MKNLQDKKTIMAHGLRSLSESIKLFDEYKSVFTHDPVQKNKQLLMSVRDSMIYRFKYNVDFFWKVIELLLEEQGIIAFATSPRGILREAIRARLLSESEGELCMKMIESCNKTSHAYHQLTAEKIAYQIPGYYELIENIVDRLRDK